MQDQPGGLVVDANGTGALLIRQDPPPPTGP